MKKRKLTPAEAKRFELFIDKTGGEVKVAGILGVSPGTVSRSLNRRTGPSPLLVEKLVEHGIVDRI
ncbi:MAG: hypothetical protein V4510_09895 [bacterium]